MTITQELAAHKAERAALESTSDAALARLAQDALKDAFASTKASGSDTERLAAWQAFQAAREVRERCEARAARKANAGEVRAASDEVWWWKRQLKRNRAVGMPTAQAEKQLRLALMRQDAALLVQAQHAADDAAREVRANPDCPELKARRRLANRRLDYARKRVYKR